MACLLHPKCNFLHGYFKCLPVETVDMELKEKMMQGIHTFRWDRTYQVIKCNPRSTRLCPYPSLVRRMKTYLDLEGRLGPKPRPQSQTKSTQNHPQQTKSWPVQPSTNRRVRKAPTPKASDKRKRTVIAWRGYKVRVLNQPVPTTTAPTTATTSNNNAYNRCCNSHTSNSA